MLQNLQEFTLQDCAKPLKNLLYPKILGNG